MLKEGFDVYQERERIDEVLAPRQGRSSMKEKSTNIIIIAIIAFFAVFLLFFSIVKVDGMSMEPTFLNKGDSVLVFKYAVPDYSDVVIVNNRDDWVFEKTGERGHSDLMIKRVIAKGGDKLRYTHNGETATVWIKFKGTNDYKILKEPYITEFTSQWLTDYEKGFHNEKYLFDKEIEVPENHVFVMGDNRAKSFDSRFFGAVPLDKIDGVAVLAVGSGGIRYV